MLTKLLLALLLLPQLPEWTVAGRARIEVGRGDVELFRVAGAAPLPGGGFVVGDRGNARLLVFAGDGALLRSMGREGSGPREFRMLWAVHTVGDTIVAYDTGLNRLSLWLASGEPLRTTALPAVDGRPVSLRAVLSGTSFVVTARQTTMEERNGLSRVLAALLLLDGHTGEYRSLDSPREWEYSYHIKERVGRVEAATSYAVPFLPPAQAVGAAGRIVIVPLEGTQADLLAVTTGTRTTVRLPVEARSFDRRVIAQYRESLLGSTPPNTPAARRIRTVFGDAFPAPQRASPIAETVTAGGEVWIRLVAEQGARTASWLVLDPVTARVVARANLPAQWRVLGGDGASLYVLQRDELDAELIGVHAIRRN